jgi:hypothetical protein
MMQAKSTERRTYTAPKLTTYGDMARYTASGTGADTETKGNKAITKKP